MPLMIVIDRQYASQVAEVLATTWLREVAWKIELGARRMVRYKSGAVRRSISTTTPTRQGGWVKASVQATHRRACLEHDGAKPHTITPRRPGGRLRFYWARVGHTVTFRSVNHPGTRGSKFLTTPMMRVAANYGFEKIQIRLGGAKGPMVNI